MHHATGPHPPPPAPPDPRPDAAPAPPWLAAALEALPVAVAVRDADGPLFANAAHRALAFPHPAGEAEELAGLEIGQVSDPASGRLYLLTRTPLGPGGVVLEVLEDITGRHSDRDEIARQRDALARDAADLERANGELAGLERARSEFIALAAHELRTPLSALSSAVQLLRRTLPVGCAPELRAECGTERFLGMAERNLRRLAVLADDLSDVTQLDPGGPAAPPAAADVAALLAEAAREAEAGADDVRVACRAHAADPVLFGDPARLARLVRHLVGHAVRRTPAGGTVRATLAAHDRWTAPPRGGPEAPPLPGPPEGWLELVVEAGAGGPPEADGTSPFDGFSAPGRGLADGRAGSGLDLAACGRIVAFHGGAAWARTEAGTRRLVVRLPRLAPAQAGLLPVCMEWARAARAGARPRLCVAAPGPGGPPLADLLAACREAAGPDARFVAVPESGEVVGVLDGEADPARVAERARRLAEESGPEAPGAHSRDGGAAPIRMGWAAPGPDRSFGDALARARAAARPVE